MLLKDYFGIDSKIEEEEEFPNKLIQYSESDEYKQKK